MSKFATENLTIYDVNKEQLDVALPSIIYLGILMVIGLIGNIFVVIVFGFKIKKPSTYRHFILVLAVYDLTACSLGMPALIYEMFKCYLFNYSVGCKILRYGYHVIAAGTSLAHAMVGVDRYRRICRATEAQITVHAARSCSYAMLAVSLLVSIPTIFIYDSEKIETVVANVTGYKCDIASKYASTPFPLFFQCLLTVFIFAVAVTMIVLYTLIGRKLYQRSQFLKHVDSRKGPSVSRTDLKLREQRREDKLNVNQHHFTNKVVPYHHDGVEISGEHESVLHTNTQDHASFTVVHHEQPVGTTIHETKYPRHKNTRAREMVSRKMTITTFAIMVIYIGSFMPLMVLELVTNIDNKITINMTTIQEAIYRLGFLSYAIDNVANPIIYIVMDHEFRKGCAALICRAK